MKGVSLPCSHSCAVKGGCTHDGLSAALLCLRQNRTTLRSLRSTALLGEPLAFANRFTLFGQWLPAAELVDHAVRSAADAFGEHRLAVVVFGVS